MVPSHMGDQYHRFHRLRSQISHTTIRPVSSTGSTLSRTLVAAEWAGSPSGWICDGLTFVLASAVNAGSSMNSSGSMTILRAIHSARRTSVTVGSHLHHDPYGVARKLILASLGRCARLRNLACSTSHVSASAAIRALSSGSNPSACTGSSRTERAATPMA